MYLKYMYKGMRVLYKNFNFDVLHIFFPNNYSIPFLMHIIFLAVDVFMIYIALYLFSLKCRQQSSKVICYDNNNLSFFCKTYTRIVQLIQYIQKSIYLLFIMRVSLQIFMHHITNSTLYKISFYLGTSRLSTHCEGSFCQKHSFLLTNSLLGAYVRLLHTYNVL